MLVGKRPETYSPSAEALGAHLDENGPGAGAVDGAHCGGGIWVGDGVADLAVAGTCARKLDIRGDGAEGILGGLCRGVKGDTRGARLRRGRACELLGHGAATGCALSTSTARHARVGEGVECGAEGMLRLSLEIWAAGRAGGTATGGHSAGAWFVSEVDGRHRVQGRRGDGRQRRAQVLRRRALHGRRAALVVWLAGAAEAAAEGCGLDDAEGDDKGVGRACPRCLAGAGVVVVWHGRRARLVVEFPPLALARRRQSAHSAGEIHDQSTHTKLPAGGSQLHSPVAGHA